MTDYSVLMPLSKRKPYIQLLVSMLIILLVALAGLILTLLSAWLIFGIPPGELQIYDSGLSSGQIAYLKYLQSLQHLSMFFLPSVFIAYFMHGNLHSYLGIHIKPGLYTSFLCFIFILFIIPLNSYLAWLNAGLDLPEFLNGLEEWLLRKEEQAETLTKTLIRSDSTGGLLINILVIAIIPALGEEFLYRGILQQIFKDWFKSGAVAVILTAFIFSATHFQFYGFLPRFVLGLGFGLILLWTGNIWYAVIAHLINNIIPVILSHYIGWDELNTSIDEFSAQDGLLALLPTIISLIVLYIIWKDKS